MPTKRLLVLDLNGTILHRLTHAFESKLFKSHPVVVKKNLKTDVTIHGSKIIYRPHSTVFLSFILKHFDVAVWTSSRPHNALPMVHHSFKNLLDFSYILEEAEGRGVTVRQIVLGPSEKAAALIKDRLLEESKDRPRLKFIWTQSECDVEEATTNTKESSDATEDIVKVAAVEILPDCCVCATEEPLEDQDKNIEKSTKEPNNEHHEESTMESLPAKEFRKSSSPSPSYIKPIRKKNLTKIYNTFPETYTPANTLIIDDTTAKLADHPRNHLQIEEFNVIDPDTDFTADKNLLQLKKYLERLIKEDPTDLRTFLYKYELSDF